MNLEDFRKGFEDSAVAMNIYTMDFRRLTKEQAENLNQFADELDVVEGDYASSALRKGWKIYKQEVTAMLCSFAVVSSVSRELIVRTLKILDVTRNRLVVHNKQSREFNEMTQTPVFTEIDLVVKELTKHG